MISGSDVVALAFIDSLIPLFLLRQTSAGIPHHWPRTPGITFHRSIPDALAWISGLAVLFTDRK